MLSVISDILPKGQSPITRLRPLPALGSHRAGPELDASQHEAEWMQLEHGHAAAQGRGSGPEPPHPETWTPHNREPRHVNAQAQPSRQR